VNAWGETVRVSWRRSLKYYEFRIPALRKLEEAGLLSGFRVRGEEEAGGRLGDPFHELSLSPTGVSGTMHLPSGDRSRIRRAMQLVLDVLQPEAITGALFGGRYLIPIQGDYDKVRRAAVRTLTSDSLQLPIMDWSLLVDLEGTKEGQEGQCEFGIVSRSEMRDRIAGVVGRLAGERVSLPDEVEFPEVALFLDQSWGQSAPFLADDVHKGLDEFWSDARLQAEAVIRRVLEGTGLEGAKGAEE
jgi:hypothetical protein